MLTFKELMDQDRPDPDGTIRMLVHILGRLSATHHYSSMHPEDLYMLMAKEVIEADAKGGADV